MTKLAPVIIGLLYSLAPFASAEPVLKIDTTKVAAHVSPMLYGLMTEEINYSYDGGLYAELIQNRIFKDDARSPAHWSIVQDKDGSGAITLDESQPVANSALTTCLKLDASGASKGHRVGVANDGYWGIPVTPKTSYRASFYAKADGAAQGPLTVGIESSDGGKVFASAQVAQITSTWQKYTATLTTEDDIPPSAASRFVISTEKPGKVWFNLVSLFPPTYHDRPNGNRPDIMKLLAEMKPAFLRFPGGNYLEGDTIDTRFPWKATLGDLSQRPGHPSCWRYRSSDGMGLLEFLEWCEDLKIEPLLAIYAGYSLKGDHIEPGATLQPFIDESLEEIEYVIGEKTTKWGAQRAKDGHPEPFKLTYVEIGNEDGFDKSGSYDGRFTQFYDAIKAKYPGLQCISTAGGKDSLGRRTPIKSRTPDLFDEHYYRNAFEMEDDAAHYDNYSRTGPKTFVGEWATREGSPTTNMNAALGDAAWMTGMERNSDVVVMSCYAPLFVNVNPGGMQWKSDLIGYNALTSYGSPSYYAQKMFSENIGDLVLSTGSEGIAVQTWQPPTRKAKTGEPSPTPPPTKQVPTLFFVATKASEKGTIYLKVVNAIGSAQTAKIDLTGATNIAPEGTAITLSSAKPDDSNSISEPKKIIPVTTKAAGLSPQFSYTFTPYSVTVLVIPSR
ncbi:MAG: alpha-L-arabinofuranosidase [Chthoniobacter sp.]|jgi:alpha-N-arabinofuranosidase|nr:alpha-L-arabinofuranosidase [Chthoniobacter sp.]